MTTVRFELLDDDKRPLKLLAIKALRQCFPNPHYTEGCGLSNVLLSLKEAKDAVDRGWIETDEAHLNIVMDNLRPFVTSLRTEGGSPELLDVLHRIQGAVARVSSKVVARGLTPVALFLEDLENRFFGGK